MHQNVGRLRKMADKMAPSNCEMKRIWISLVTIASTITLVTIVDESLQAALFYPRKLVYSHSDGYGRNHLLWEQSRVQELATDAIPGHSELTLVSVKSDPISAEFYSRKNDEEITVPYIEDVVALPESMDLFLVRQVANFPDKDSVSACQYGEGKEMKSSVKSVDFVDERLAVICERPSEAHGLVRIEDLSLELDRGESSALLPKVDYIVPARWDAPLVYAVQSVEEYVIVYAKGLFEKRKSDDSMDLKNFRCIFGTSLGTAVVAAAQELYHCERPVIDEEMQQPRRYKVRLLYKGTFIPSVAYYDFSSNVGSTELASREEVRKQNARKYFVCSCTMIWNSAKFLKEWVMFNSDLGVEKFFLYDNNSEDDIESAVSNLSQYNVTRRNWPWVKTQEAGFSHCAVEAQRECTWIMFTDVDEYLFPKRWLQLAEPPAEASATALNKTRPSALAALINDTLAKPMRGSKLLPPDMVLPKVGQISFLCRNFGPSGQTAHPSHGVTQGYTCREQREQRHKSLVFFPALQSSLQNVIHHFKLRPEFQTMYLDPRQAVVNHYKFQAWSEFETKFTKRASTYVADWKERKNLGSRDRPKGLGPVATKPAEWETSHCDLNDTALRDYTRRRFGVVGDGHNAVRMAWEL